LGPILAWAAEPLPRSVSVFDQSDLRSPFYLAVFSGLRSTANARHGIPQSQLAQIFRPFFMTKDKGMRMGLSIASTIVEIHRGKITADNDAGGGAVFGMNLPLAKS
jgi:hypothetical protein